MSVHSVSNPPSGFSSATEPPDVDVSEPPPAPTADVFRAFYAHYCPSDIDVVGHVLAGYRGREHVLWERLQKKYGPWPPEGAEESAGADVGRTETVASNTRRMGASAVLGAAEAPDPHPQGPRRRRGTVFGALDGVPALHGVRGRALCVGIDYVGMQHAPAPGALAAARKVAATLPAAGFQGPVRLLVDDGNVDLLPTQSKIVAALEWLCSGARPGDGFVVFIAGMVQSGWHASGALLCADHRTGGQLSGSQIIHTICSRLPKGARALIVVDGRPVGTFVEFPNRMIAHGDGTCEEPRTHQRPTAEVQSAFDAAGDKVAVVSMSRPSAGVVVSGLKRQQQQQQQPAGHGEADSEPLVFAGDAAAAALLRLRRPPADPPAAVAALPSFLDSVSARFGQLLHPLVQGGYPARAFAAWPSQPLSALQQELGSWGIPALRAAPLQTIARACFGSIGSTVGKGTPADARDPCCTLREFVYGLREEVTEALGEAAAIAPLTEAAVPLAGLLDKPVLPCILTTPSETWGALGEFPQTPLIAETGGFKPRVGYISSGGDVLNSPRLLTVSEAVQIAAAHPECRGFCFKGVRPAADERVLVYFKDKVDVHGRGWTAYCRDDGDAQPWNPAANPHSVEETLAAIIWADRQKPHQTTPAAAPRRQPDGSPSDQNTQGRVWVDPATKRRLWRFYLKHNPTKLPTIVDSLRLYAGREEELFKALVERYGEEPPPLMDTRQLPRGWRLVEGPGGELFFRHTDGRKQWEWPLPTGAI
eukprot:TRINITY_DN4506_c0_g2_i1.p1 TRINITY_DN4506_c0_g2~~TRINITY_DN4506_c0_g2_i1.p1  ORF type:complete len:762 (+),score=109.24 TRINITY_DN4506_c0_g2_i1:72-2357(+)